LPFYLFFFFISNFKFQIGFLKSKDAGVLKFLRLNNLSAKLFHPFPEFIDPVNYSGWVDENKFWWGVRVCFPLLLCLFASVRIKSFDGLVQHKKVGGGECKLGQPGGGGEVSCDKVDDWLLVFEEEKKICSKGRIDGFHRPPCALPNSQRLLMFPFLEFLNGGKSPPGEKKTSFTCVIA
jgi:hypothetical protein